MRKKKKKRERRGEDHGKKKCLQSSHIMFLFSEIAITTIYTCHSLCTAHFSFIPSTSETALSVISAAAAAVVVVASVV